MYYNVLILQWILKLKNLICLIQIFNKMSVEYM